MWDLKIDVDWPLKQNSEGCAQLSLRVAALAWNSFAVPLLIYVVSGFLLQFSVAACVR